MFLLCGSLLQMWWEAGMALELRRGQGAHPAVVMKCSESSKARASLLPNQGAEPEVTGLGSLGCSWLCSAGVGMLLSWELA